jgi:hypothetical protein
MHPKRQIRTRGLYVYMTLLVLCCLLIPLLCGWIANSNNGIRCLSRWVSNRYRVRRRDDDIRIHICTHQEIPKRDPQDPRSLCVLTAVLPVITGAPNCGSGFRVTYSTNRTSRSCCSHLPRPNPEGAHPRRHGHGNRVKREKRIVLRKGLSVIPHGPSGGVVALMTLFL